jgi:hypothetical protein
MKEKPWGVLNMEEPVVDVVEKTEPVIEKPEHVVEIPKSLSQPSEPNIQQPTKNKGGRPAGSKDKAPRRKKIIEEPIVQQLPKPEPVPPEPQAEPKAEPPEPKAKPKPEPNAVHVEPEPLSPRTLIRESARHMLELKRLNDSARKSHLQNAYTRRLAAF